MRLQIQEENKGRRKSGRQQAVENVEDAPAAAGGKLSGSSVVSGWRAVSKRLEASGRVLCTKAEICRRC